MVVSNVVEKVDFILLEHKRCGDRMYGGITPAFVEETTVLVKSVEVIDVCLRTEPIKVTNLEIRPLKD